MPLAPECPEEMPGYTETCEECGESLPHCRCCSCPRCDPDPDDYYDDHYEINDGPY